jgi:hypothetical protein
VPEQVERPIPDSYWVQPGRLLAGEYPRTKDDAASGPKLRRLLNAGVTFFLDLTEEGEYGLKPYVTILRQEAAALGRAVIHRRLSILDGGIPSSMEMLYILDTLDAALADGQVAYVHCWGGIGM